MKLGEMLVEAGKVSERDIERALLAQNEMGGLLGQVLVRLGLVSEMDVAQVLQEQLGVSLVAASDYPEEMEVIEGLSLDFLINSQVVPLALSEGEARFAALVPQDNYLNKALSLALPGRQVTVQLGLEADVAAALGRYEEGSDEDESEQLLVTAADSEDFVEHLRDLASEAPVIRLVNQLIQRAVDLGASDIHLEPFENRLALRYRVDGVIAEVDDPPALALAAAIASRIKLLANLDIAERRLPQDGRIMTRVKGHELDLRVATTPTVHGEAIVMRVLDRENIRFSLADMGFSADTLENYRELLSRAHGVLLLTGPTGSGKTTTLYASLASMDSASLKIITVEDPVEYQLSGINQMQVQGGIGLTFARSLRSILRQDPDIIMIGEMRDTETAQIAVQSALTGHLVLSTLHTNTAAGAITRLEDMGVERYLITSSVNGVLAQRLVRRLCMECREAVDVQNPAVQSSGVSRFLEAGQTHVFRGTGCDSCKNTGYSGRVAIHELLVMDPEMQKMVLAGADASSLHSAVRGKGMLTLYEDGLRKVAAGTTSLEELLRVTQDQSEQELVA